MISERIYKLMVALGENKNSFSKAIGIENNVTIGRIINEKREPSFDILNRILQTFGNVDANWLLTGTGEMFINTPPQYDNNSTPNSTPIANNSTPTGKMLTKNEQSLVNEPANEGYAKHPPGKCEICIEKDRIIESMHDTISAKNVALEALIDQVQCLRDKIDELTDGEQKRKAG